MQAGHHCPSEGLLGGILFTQNECGSQWQQLNGENAKNVLLDLATVCGAPLKIKPRERGNKIPKKKYILFLFLSILTRHSQWKIQKNKPAFISLAPFAVRTGWAAFTYGSNMTNTESETEKRSKTDS